MAEQILSIDAINRDECLQMRDKITKAVVSEYRLMITGDDWPFEKPLVVFFDGQRHWLADGFHRIAACKLAERKTVNCDVKNGTLEDAQDYALQANGGHGLKRSNADKKKAVKFALNCERWINKSDRMIAKHIGVSDPFVGSIRKQLLTVSSCDEREGADGRKRKVKEKPETSSESDTQVDDTEKDVSEDSEAKPESESKKSGGINGLREILSKNDEFENVVDEAIDYLRDLDVEHYSIAKAYFREWRIEQVEYYDVEEPVEKEPKKTKKPKKPKKPKEPEEPEDPENPRLDFQRDFWSKYPNKQGMRESQLRWKGLSEKERQECVEAAERYKAYVAAGGNSGYYKHGITFMNNWRDYGPEFEPIERSEAIKDFRDKTDQERAKDASAIAIEQAEREAEMDRICAEYDQQQTNGIKHAGQGQARLTNSA